MTTLLKDEVFGIRCKKCGDAIYSHHRHDMRFCRCGAVAIDGGRDYIKLSGEPANMESIVINTETNDFYTIE